MIDYQLPIENAMHKSSRSSQVRFNCHHIHVFYYWFSVRQGLWNFVWQFSLSLEFEVIFLPHVFAVTFNTSCLLYEQIQHSIKKMDRDIAI